MAPSKKKSNKKSFVVESNSGAAAPAATTTVPAGPASTKSVPPLSNGLFTLIILLGVGIKFALDYSHAVADGLQSSECAAYIQDVTACSATDVAMIRLKYDSALTTIAMVTMTVVNVRKNEAILLRLLMALLVAPLSLTLVVLQTTRTLMDPMKNFWMCMNVTVLMMISVSAFGNTASSTDSTIAPARVMAPLVRSVDVSTITVFTIIIIRIYDLIKFMQEETQGYVIVQPADMPVTNPAKALLYFIVVDKGTIIAVLIFALLFLNYRNKCTFLFWFSLVNAAAGLHLVPNSADILVDKAYQAQFCMGNAFFCLLAAVGPNVTLFDFDSHKTSSQPLMTNGGDHKEN